jgi:hypothetical protein
VGRITSHTAIVVLALSALLFTVACGGSPGTPGAQALAAQPAASATSAAPAASGSTTGDPPSATGSSGSAPVTSSPSSPASPAFDAYPASAAITSNMEDAAWISCNCGGTGAVPSSQSLTQTGGAATATITGSGSGVSGWLWYSNLPSNNASNWIMDYEITPTRLAGAAALEFDGNQTGTLGNFVFGTECNYGYNPTGKTVWRFWTMSGGSQTWGTTSFACPITQVNHTYRVQMHFVASPGQYQVSRVQVTDMTTGVIVEDDRNLGTFSAVGSHGNSIDIQLDAAGSSTISARYQNISIVRW